MEIELVQGCFDVSRGCEWPVAPLLSFPLSSSLLGNPAVDYDITCIGRVITLSRVALYVRSRSTVELRITSQEWILLDWLKFPNSKQYVHPTRILLLTTVMMNLAES